MIADAFVLLVALLHFGFFILEAVLWTKPIGHKIFRLNPGFAQASKALAANQGLYNGILAIGLLWSLEQPDSGFAYQLKIFFLTSVIGAGIFGALTVNKRIFFLQSLPAMIAIALVHFVSHA